MHLKMSENFARKCIILHKIFKTFLGPRTHPLPFRPLFQISGSATDPIACSNCSNFHKFVRPTYKRFYVFRLKHTPGPVSVGARLPLSDFVRAFFFAAGYICYSKDDDDDER